MLAMRHRGGHRAALCLFATVLAVAAGLAAAAPGLTEWSLKLNPQDSQGSVTGGSMRPHAVLRSGRLPRLKHAHLCCCRSGAPPASEALCVCLLPLSASNAQPVCHTE
jgi:hypothetical protein